MLNLVRFLFTIFPPAICHYEGDTRDHVAGAAVSKQAGSRRCFGSILIVSCCDYTVSACVAAICQLLNSHE